MPLGRVEGEFGQDWGATKRLKLWENSWQKLSTALPQNHGEPTGRK